MRTILPYLPTLFFCLTGLMYSEAEDRPGTVELSPLQKKFRRPHDVCLLDDGRTLVTANSRSGTVSVIHTTDKSASKEFPVASQPVAITELGQGRFAVADKKENLIKIYRWDGETVSELQSLPIERTPVAISRSPQGNDLLVSCLWDRSISLLDASNSFRKTWQCPLPFEPKHSIFSLDGTWAVVFDAFDSQGVIIDVASGDVLKIFSFHGHNIGGVTWLSSSRLMLTHQILHDDSPTTSANIAGGRVIENVFQEIEITRNGDSVTVAPVVLSELGEPSHGAADPSGIVIDHEGQRWIAVAGQGEILVLNRFGVVINELIVGHRPTELVLSHDGRTIYCLNRLSESISVIDVSSQQVLSTMSLGGTPEAGPRERGEQLYFDAGQSQLGWMSCHSCHADGHTNGQLADTFGDGEAGAPKRVLSLLGGRDNNPWAWNGSMRSLHDQVLKSGDTTMRGKGFSAREANDIVAYLHTLDPPPPYDPPQTESALQQTERGQKLFHRLGCANCHVPPLTYTSDGNFDVGLSDEHGLSKFNPPSLNAVGYRRRLLHDGRAGTLEEVFTEYGHQIDDQLSEEELKDLIRFLRSL